jgi:hypothetical protein
MQIKHDIERRFSKPGYRFAPWHVLPLLGAIGVAGFALRRILAGPAAQHAWSEHQAAPSQYPPDLRREWEAWPATAAGAPRADGPLDVVLASPTAALPPAEDVTLLLEAEVIHEAIVERGAADVGQELADAPTGESLVPTGTPVTGDAEVQSPGMVKLEGVELETVSPDSDSDIRDVVHSTLDTKPNAEFQDVLAAWHVRRGTSIDEAEAERVRAVYERETETLLRGGASDAAA